MAQFLCTRSEPKLVSEEFHLNTSYANSNQYYKPWELLPGDAERIQQQIADTEALIDREIQEFNQRNKTDLQPEERPRGNMKDSAAETEGEHHAESSPIPPVPPVAQSDSTNPLPPVQATESAPVTVLAERDPLEENGEVVVEGDEDTVIY
jgi:hypothetical protein